MRPRYTNPLFTPTRIIWNLNEASRKVMGKKWCEWKDAEELKFEQLKNFHETKEKIHDLLGDLADRFPGSEIAVGKP